MTARVTRSSGQKRSFCDGLQPRVMPAVASFSMSDSKIELSSSTNETTRCRSVPAHERGTPPSAHRTM